MKADRSNKKLNTLQQASRHVNDMAAVVVTSTKQGQQQFSDRGEEKRLGSHPHHHCEQSCCVTVSTLKLQSVHILMLHVTLTDPRCSDVFPGVMDFSGLSLIKLKKEEMEAQVSVSM